LFVVWGGGVVGEGVVCGGWGGVGCVLAGAVAAGRGAPGRRSVAMILRPSAVVATATDQRNARGGHEEFLTSFVSSYIGREHRAQDVLEQSGLDQARVDAGACCVESGKKRGNKGGSFDLHRTPGWTTVTASAVRVEVRGTTSPMRTSDKASLATCALASMRKRHQLIVRVRA